MERLSRPCRTPRTTRCWPLSRPETKHTNISADRQHTHNHKKKEDFFGSQFWHKGGDRLTTRHTEKVPIEKLGGTKTNRQKFGWIGFGEGRGNLAISTFERRKNTHIFVH